MDPTFTSNDELEYLGRIELNMKNSAKVQVYVGRFQDMVTRFTNAWNQTSKGVKVKETNDKSLAISLGRDYKNDYHDESVLFSAGFLLQNGRNLLAPLNELSTYVSLKMA